MRILLVNLTRFGDLLQTQPVVTGLAGQGHDVRLACLENFAGAAGLLRDLGGASSLPGAAFLAGLDRDWRLALRDLRAWTSALRAEVRPELCVNLTPNLSSQLLCRLFEAPARGFYLDEFGFGRFSGPWAAFLQAASLNRGSSPFNLVDIFRRVAESGTGRGEFRLRRPDPDLGRSVLARAGLTLPEGGLLAIQLGASAEQRRWPVASFAQMAASVRAATGLTPLLLGSPSEKPLGERFAAAVDFPVLDLIGRTSLPELAGVLSLARLLVSNDTGTMHLAAGLGLPVAGIFLATAQPWDTGPYLADSLSLEPDLECHPCAFGLDCPRNHACRTSLPSEAVGAAVDVLLSGREPDGESVWTGARVWRAGFDAEGFMDLRSLSGHEASDRTAWVRLQRGIYRQFLDCAPVSPDPAIPAGLSGETATELGSVLAEAGSLLGLLREQGVLLARMPREAVKNRFLANWQKVQNALSRSPRLATLQRLWLAESQEAGGDLPRILELITRYRALMAGLSAGVAASRS